MTKENSQSTTNKRESKANVCHNLSKISLAVTAFLEKIFYRQEKSECKSNPFDLFSQMGSGNLNMAKGDNFDLLACLWRSDQWDDVLVPGDGPGSSVDTLQLTRKSQRNLI